MPRSLSRIGIALLDGDAGPEIAKWGLELLEPARRTYLPAPIVSTYSGRVALRFTLGGGLLAVLAARPEDMWWNRIHLDGVNDRGMITGPPGQRETRAESNLKFRRHSS